MAKKFLHQDTDFPTLISRVAQDMGINPYLVEKDYWIMHCLYGLQAQGFDFELKGGTSLSKGFKIIHRFSEDIDLRITPPPGHKVYTGKNHMKPAHIESRRAYFDWLADNIKIDGTIAAREHAFDDTERMRNAGITLSYGSAFETVPGVKPSVLLEAGFDDTTPNVPITISSWAADHAFKDGIGDFIDNRALNVKCYVPEYTFIEKLQALSTKHRKLRETGKIDKNFIRHYYDVYCLLEIERVSDFIGSIAYIDRKRERFPKKDAPLALSSNAAFLPQHPEHLALLLEGYNNTQALYYRGRPTLDEIFTRIASVAIKL